MKSLSVISILVFSNVIQCSSWFSYTRWLFGYNVHRTIPELKIPGEPDDQSIQDALKAEAAKTNSISIFVNNVIINESQSMGAMYYSSWPSWFKARNFSILLVESLNFINYSDSLPWSKESIEEVLVTYDIFDGMISPLLKKPVLVGNVRLRNRDLGPIFLSAPRSYKSYKSSSDDD
jgi:hypothetical protein